MEFIKEIVEISDEKVDIDTKQTITKLISTIRRYQMQTKNYIDSNFVEFLSNVTLNPLILEQGDKLINEINNLLENIENTTKNELNDANKELIQYIEELKELYVGIKTTSKILKIDEIFQSLEISKTNNDYTIIMDKISQMQSLIEDDNDNILKLTDCYPNIKLRYNIECEILKQNLIENFENLIQYSVKPFRSTNLVQIKISKQDEKLNHILKSLLKIKYNPNKFFEFLLINVFQPIITQPVALELNEQDRNYIILTISHSIKNTSGTYKPNYKTVIKQIEDVIKCLTYINNEISDESMVSMCGDYIKEEFLKILINDCFMHSLPDTLEEMNNSTLVEDITTLNSFLIQNYFLKSDIDMDLLEYSQKIDKLFRNRFCIKILDTANDIMKKDLHDLTITEIKLFNVGPGLPTTSKCQISKSTMEITDLLENILNQITQTDEESNKHLFPIITTILESYMIEVPRYHEKVLKTLPKITAIFYNNCNILALWGLKNSKKGFKSFSTIKSLQVTASEYFDEQVKQQRLQIHEILKKFDLTGITQLTTEHHKIIQQCIKQFDLLKNAWQDILPEDVYKKTIGTLMNDFYNEIIRKILNMEDISSLAGNQLYEKCSVIIEHGPTLLKEPMEISVIVKSWTKLTQLKMILNASLLQIIDQWSEGRGPLTLNYKAEEIKNLIRALFQNTDRRAHALAAII